MAPGYRARVDRAYQDSLLKREAADELVEAGNVDAGLARTEHSPNALQRNMTRN